MGWSLCGVTKSQYLYLLSSTPRPQTVVGSMVWGPREPNFLYSGIIPVGFREHYGMLGSELGSLATKETPYLLCYHSDPDIRLLDRDKEYDARRIIWKTLDSVV